MISYRFIIKIVAIFSIATLLFSCKQSANVVSKNIIQKRKYTSGFYTVLKKKNELSSSALSLNKLDNQQKSIIHNNLLHYNNLTKLLTPVEIRDTIKKEEDEYFVEQKCDIIVLKNGDVIEAKVLEVRQTEINYKLCNNTEGPTFFKNNYDIEYIQFPNGSVTTFKDALPPPVKEVKSQYPSYNETPKRKPEGLSIAGLVISILALGSINAGTLLFLSFLAFLFCFIGIIKITNRPTRLKGIGLAIAGLIIALIELLIALAFI